MPLTDSDIAEIEARLKAAPCGPFRVAENFWNLKNLPWRGAVGIEADLDLAVPSLVAWLTRGYDNDALAKLFAHAPTDIATLLEEVRRLRAELAQEQSHPADTSAKAESEVLDSSCAKLPFAEVKIRQWGQYVCGGLIASVSVGGFKMECRTAASPGSETGKRFTAAFEALRTIRQPSPTESAMREALEKAQAKFSEARNCLGQKEAFRLLEEASDIIDTALQIAKERG
jgi:hypothetical protein